MTVYTSKTGLTALKVIDEVTSVYCACYRLNSKLWHHVGNTEPFDPSIEAKVLEGMFHEMVENLDQQEFDLSKSMAEIEEGKLSSESPS